VYPDKDQVRIHGKEHTSEYMYGKKYGADHFCTTCGVYVFATVIGPPLSVFDKVPPERKEFVMSVYRKNVRMLPLNVRCMEGLDIASLKINKTDYGAEDYELPA
jgi:predicted nuclease with RNAse H fold